jgi:hypothetical protein
MGATAGDIAVPRIAAGLATATLLTGMPGPVPQRFLGVVPVVEERVGTGRSGSGRYPAGTDSDVADGHTQRRQGALE